MDRGPRAGGRCARILLVILVPCVSISVAGEGGALDLRVLQEELDRLAAHMEGTAGPPDVVRSRRVQALLSSVGTQARGGGAAGEEAWTFLQRTAVRRERRLAVESVIVLLDLPGDEGLVRLTGVLGKMDRAVRRYALERLITTKRRLVAASGHILRALRGPMDPESRVLLVDLAAGLNSVESARGLLDTAPPLPRISKADRFRKIPPRRPVPDEPWKVVLEPDPHTVVRRSLVTSLASMKRPAVRWWLDGPAFSVEKADSEEGAPRLWVLCHVARTRKAARARACLDRVLSHADARVGAAALEALAALGPESSRRPLETLVRAGGRAAVLRAWAAVLLDRLGDCPEVRFSLQLSESENWKVRQSAALALAAFPRSDLALQRLCALVENDANRNVRQAAYRALRYVRRKDVIPRLIRLLAPLRGKDPAMVVEYLRWVSGQKLGPDHRAWRAWWQGVRESFQFPPLRQAREK